jgi:hypothetical protein
MWLARGAMDLKKFKNHCLILKGADFIIFIVINAYFVG